MDYQNEFHVFIDHLKATVAATSDQRINQLESNFHELLIWLDFLKTALPQAKAKELLDGTRASMLETMAYIGMGLGRAAISAMRTQIDLLLGFTYFFDHPTEWRRIKETGQGFHLKKELLDYNKKHRNTGEVYTKIKGTSSPDLDQVYQILSAHIHGQSSHTLPSAGTFPELINTPEFCDSLVALQGLISLNLSNYLAAVFLNEDVGIPSEVETRLKNSLQEKIIKDLFFK